MRFRVVGTTCSEILRSAQNDNPTSLVRKILITLGILIAFIVAVFPSWIFGGRQLSLLLDRFWTIETASSRINSVVYEGSGTDGLLHINDLALSLNDRNGPSPTVGTTKDSELALANTGKVFAFGPPRSEAENLAAVPAANDDALIAVPRSFLSWPTPFDLNFMSGHSPSWKRHLYYQVRWHKQNGAKLEMRWRYEQYFYPGDGWASGFMTHEGSTGLIRLDIQP